MQCVWHTLQAHTPADAPVWWRWRQPQVNHLSSFLLTSPILSSQALWGTGSQADAISKAPAHSRVVSSDQEGIINFHILIRIFVVWCLCSGGVIMSAEPKLCLVAACCGVHWNADCELTALQSQVCKDFFFSAFIFRSYRCGCKRQPVPILQHSASSAVLLSHTPRETGSQIVHECVSWVCGHSILQKAQWRAHGILCASRQCATIATDCVSNWPVNLAALSH